MTSVYDFVDDLGVIFDNDLITLFVEFALEYEAAIGINRYSYYLDFTLMHISYGESLLPVGIAPGIGHSRTAQIDEISDLITPHSTP